MKYINKVNNYSVKDFEKIGISSTIIYRYIYKYKKENFIISEKLFQFKYGKDLPKYEAFEFYYLCKFKDIHNVNEFTLYSVKFFKIKDEFIEASRLFKMNSKKIDILWDNIMDQIEFKTKKTTIK